jgi:hypothetical protein
MALLDQVKTICNRLAAHGWRDLLLQHGLDITAQDLKAELLKELPNIDRSKNGFVDFAIGGSRGVEPGRPAHSLLFHALASPNITRGANNQDLSAFPSLSEIEVVENYVYGIQPPSLQKLSGQVRDLTTQFQEGSMAIAVFASEYRPGPETTHKRHADMCFSRTGVARVGTSQALYDSRLRGFLPFDKNDDYAFRVLPVRYSPYIAVQLSRKVLKDRFKDAFGPMRNNLADGEDENRNFWVPLHKLFNGNECIQGLDLHVTLKTHHVNEKVKRIHVELEKTPNYPKVQKELLDKPPYRFTADIAEISGNADFGQGLLVPLVHSPLVQAAEHDGKPVVLWVPSNSNSSWAPSFLIEGENGSRHAPEYVHIRHKVVNSRNLVDVGSDRDVVQITRKGGYEAQHYLDFTGDGWVEVFCPELAAELPRGVPAYSLVTAPDFFPNVDQGELLDWYIHNVPASLRDESWYNPGRQRNLLLTLSDERLAPNIELNYDSATGRFNDKYPFRLEDDSVTAIVSLPITGDNISTSFEEQSLTTMRHSYLPDAASGVYAPGWDVSQDNSRGINHLAAYGLGSPFPEDAKLCAALSAYWPAVAPDAGRSFWWSERGGAFPTVCPLTDEEIGSTGNLPWDGYNGPKLSNTDKDVAEYYKSEYVDYVAKTLEKRFTLSLTGKIDISEYKLRILSMAKTFRSLQKLRSNIGTRLKDTWPVLSFKKVQLEDTEVQSAQSQSGETLQGDIYRVEIFRTEQRVNQPDYKHNHVRINDRYVFLSGAGQMTLVKHNGDNWIAI